MSFKLQVPECCSAHCFALCKLTNYSDTLTGLFHETLAVRFGIDIDGVRLAATLMARMLEKSVGEFPVRDVLNVHCWLATIPPLLVGSSQSLSFQDLKISLGDIGVQLDCIDCRSTMSRTTIEGISTAFSSQSQSLNGHITSIASHFLRDEALMRWLRNAPTQCPHHRDYKPVTTNAVSNAPVTETVTKTSQSDDISILIGISAMVACLVVACLAAMTHLRKRQQTSKSGEATTTATASPLFISDQVPKMTKWLVPTFVLASILLSIAGFTEDSFHMLLSANIVELDLFQMDMHFSMLELAAEAWQGNNTGFTVRARIASGRTIVDFSTSPLITTVLQRRRC